MNVILSEKEKELPDVTVEPYQKATWKEWGEFFTQHFLGQTGNARQSRILNTRDIAFRHYQKSGRLVAVNKKPIRVRNMALGYLVQYDLQNFEYSFKDRYCTYSGFAFFKEIKSSGEGFNVVRLRKIVNEAKKKAKEELRIASQSGQPVRIDGKNSVFSQPDSIDVIYSKTLTADSISGKYEGQVYLYFPHYLSIGHPSFEEPVRMKNKDYLGAEISRRADIKILGEQPVIIYADGNFSPAEAIVNIYRWSFTENISNLLPLDYVPSKK
ncbi:MAG: hypothetical protein QM727_02650 [Niabella sp.]